MQRSGEEPREIVIEAGAGLYSIEADTVAAYRSRGQMPEPTLFGRTPMWKRDVIEEWHATRPGRGWRAQS